MNLAKILRIPSRQHVTQFFIPKHESVNPRDIEVVREFLRDKPKILVVTGAGISTESGELCCLVLTIKWVFIFKFAILQSGSSIFKLGQHEPSIFYLDHHEPSPFFTTLQFPKTFQAFPTTGRRAWVSTNAPTTSPCSIPNSSGRTSSESATGLETFSAGPSSVPSNRTSRTRSSRSWKRTKNSCTS
jgi:hypothetical protein